MNKITLLPFQLIQRLIISNVCKAPKFSAEIYSFICAGKQSEFEFSIK